MEPVALPRLFRCRLIAALTGLGVPDRLMAFGVTHHSDTRFTAFLIHEDWPERHCVHSLTEHQDRAPAALDALYAEYQDAHPGQAWVMELLRYGPDGPHITFSDATPPPPQPRHRRRRDP